VETNPIQPLNPATSIETYRNNIRIKDCSYIGIITDVARLLSPLHKTQALSMREKWRQNDYITRTDFNMLKSIFERYAGEINLHFTPKVAKSGDAQRVLNVMAIGTIEVAAFDKHIAELLDQQAKASSGNFSVKIRPDATVSNPDQSEGAGQV